MANSLSREFIGVRKNTSYPGLFESTANIDLIRKSDVIKLVEMLAYHCLFTATIPMATPRRHRIWTTMPKITWGTRSWACWQRNQLNFENPGRNTLTVHVVLHEFAHLIARSVKKDGERRRRSHGTAFRLCLDAMMITWRDKIRTNFIEETQPRGNR